MRGRAISSWLFLGALFVLCGVLGVLQYRWIGEVSVAARERMHGSLQASLNRVSQDFNSEISSATRALMPAGSPADPEAVERGVLANLDHSLRPFQRIAIAVPRNGALVLRQLDFDKRVFMTADWPEAWKSMQARLTARLNTGQPPMMSNEGDSLIFESPVMGSAGEVRSPAPPGFPRREIAWLVFELNLPYLRDTLLPEVLQRHFDSLDYQVEVVSHAPSQQVIYQSDTAAGRIAGTADASVALLDTVTRMSGPGRGRGPGPAPGPGFGRWQLFARHKAGSLEAAVAMVRQRNLAINAGVLLLLIATAAALVRFTRRAQRLAALQMDFVAGVSHELRTPLTVIHTAAYNLRGKTAANPAQVERYGELIQQESARLKDLVEQVLRYAGASSGRVIREPEPISIETVIGDTLQAGQAEIESANGTLESTVEAGLPAIMGDPVALRHAVGNLVSNAVKYGLGDQHWIGVFASRAGDGVEIRVADRGPGIPADEQPHIFDPFFRGRRAMQDQIHGTGLGLNLVKKIVEAHGGSIRVKSQPSTGTEFIVRLPVPANGGTA
jgi:signal transduction histidine kinase